MKDKNLYQFVVQGEELRHWGVLGQKWGILRYQYPDGSLTPLGREHYGVGPPRNPNETGAEKIKRYTKAALDTAAGYGLVKYTKKETVTKGDRFAKARLAKQQKADEKRANEAYKKRQEEKAKAKEEFAKKEEELHKEKTKDTAKTKRWEDYTDEELEAYIKRVGLESRATDARLLKIDTTRKAIAELVSYGKTGADLLRTYNDIMGMVKSNSKNKNISQEKVPTISEKLAKEYLKQISNDMGEDFDISKLDSDSLKNAIDIIGKVKKLENDEKGNQQNQNQQQNQQQKKKGN